MKRAPSLRLRLAAIILIPLVTLASVAGLWQLGNARATAAEVFDRSLLSAALAVSNDVAISGGDALSTQTRDILASTSGGPVFYHVYAPDGVIVAGYATPPVGIPQTASEAAGPTYFNARYLGRNVSGVRLQNRTQIDGFAGIFTTTVWQDSEVRRAFVRDLVFRSFVVISSLIAALALIVWFGIRLGLRPLNDLEAAIEARSSDELTPIRRAVPAEVEGIVGTLNRLFGQVSKSMTAQSEFIANAAHQLRNPIAGVLSLAEATANAPDEDATKRRAADLLKAAQTTADLGQKLLLLERAESISPQSEHMPLDMANYLPEWLETLTSQTPEDVSLSLTAPEALPEISGDPTMLKEALSNLVHNALAHGGPGLSAIRIDAERAADELVLTVDDNGKGIPEDDIPRALERFTLISETSASGLGLSIVQAVVQVHQGTFRMKNLSPGLRAEIRLPVI